jgi:hypothetical protein
MTNFHPTSELVACAWVVSIPGFPLGTSGVMTQSTKQENWPVINNISQIVTCTVVGGSPGVSDQVPIAKPVVQFKAWATKLSGSMKPPWFVANELLEQIRVACYERDYQVFGRILNIQANGVTYNGATVHGTTVHTEPRRIRADPRNYAVYQMDVGFTWVEVNLVIPGA